MGGPGGVGALKEAGALKGGPEARAGANTVCSVPCLLGVEDGVGTHGALLHVVERARQHETA